ncbi:hypothetical protein BC332_27413 [Capsicum chinense]|nr:hypothetical protein BC332_27413 [Capsicum chinense]
MDTIQPDPPDHMALDTAKQDPISRNTQEKLNFLRTLAQPAPMLQLSDQTQQIAIDTDMNMGSNESQASDNILLTKDDKDRIHKPWAYSVIIKLTKIKISHEYLKHKLKLLWKPNEEVILIDLGNNYFTVKFMKEENMIIAIQKGPWFINGAFLSV